MALESRMGERLRERVHLETGPVRADLSALQSQVAALDAQVDGLVDQLEAASSTQGALAELTKQVERLEVEGRRRHEAAQVEAERQAEARRQLAEEQRQLAEHTAAADEHKREAKAAHVALSQSVGQVVNALPSALRNVFY